MPPIFNTICESPKMQIWCKFGESSSNPLKVIARTSQNSKSQLPPFSIPTESIPESMFVANLVNVAPIYDELWRGQAIFPIILSQNGQNDLEVQDQWPPFSIPAESIPGLMFGANLVIVAQIYDDLSCGQAKFSRILSQKDLEGQGQWPLFSIPSESIPWCKFGANLVMPAQTCDELSCGQGKVYGQTDGRTDGQTQATTIPLRPEKQRVKNWDTKQRGVNHILEMIERGEGDFVYYVNRINTTYMRK